MSNTLRSLYTDFRERFGHFSTYPDDVDPIFLSKRQKIIEDALNSYEAGEYFSAYDEMIKRSEEIGNITSGDPIPSIILVRLVDRMFEAGVKDRVPERMMEFFVALTEANRSAALGWPSLNLTVMQDGLDEMGIPNPSPLEARPLLASLKYLHQYTLFRCIGNLIHSKGETDSLVAQWRERKFESHNDYTDVHPFLTSLCPPYHMWKQFILDNQVYEMLQDGNVKQTSVEKFEKKSSPVSINPFFHISARSTERDGK